jgi:photosystem II stability/assembly factor-like uncharacterized protein
VRGTTVLLVASALGLVLSATGCGTATRTGGTVQVRGPAHGSPRGLLLAAAGSSSASASAVGPSAVPPPVSASSTPDVSETTQILAATLFGPADGALLMQTCTGSRWNTWVQLTSDGGRSWRRSTDVAEVSAPDGCWSPARYDPPTAGLSVVDVDHLTVWGAGLWTTQDAGRSWTRTATAQPVVSAAVSGREVWALTSVCPGDGHCRTGLLRVDDHGRAVPVGVPKRSASTGWPSAIHAGGDLVLLTVEGPAAGHSGLFTTVDQGRHWSEAALPEPGCPVGNPVALDDTTILTVCTSGAPTASSDPKSIHLSRDRGRSWVNAGPVEQGCCADTLIAAPHGPLWRVGGSTSIYTSTDSGRTWTAHRPAGRSSSADEDLYSFTAYGSSAWASGYTNLTPRRPVVYATRDAGRHWTTLRPHA